MLSAQQSSMASSLLTPAAASAGNDVGSSSSASEEGWDDPTAPHYYAHQLVDHRFGDGSDTEEGAHHRKHHYAQRYFQKLDYFAGPGSPIFLILGGEDPLENLLYPFVYETLARQFEAATFALEHRFFGASYPIGGDVANGTAFPTHHELAELLTPNQALWDAVRFVQAKRVELGCSLDSTQKDSYCPVISVGGSYPGFLSALLRYRHSDVVDISYASSAPFHLYAHHVNQYAYYDKVTTTADAAVPGCADAVRTALYTAQADILGAATTSAASGRGGIDHIARSYGVCQGSVPDYIDSPALLARELILILITHFANGNMDFYPPSLDQSFAQSCLAFQDPANPTPADKIKAFLLLDNSDDENTDCFDMMTELPPGPHGTISASDWSGVGSGPEGFYWEFLSCQLIPECGFGPESMFPQRDWSLDWVTGQCESRFGWKPDVHALNDQFHFDDAESRQHVTRLLLTNGIVDGWSVASILTESDDAPGTRVVNMINGAHHSDLSHTGPTDQDTPDVKEAFVTIAAILQDWLEEINSN
jgi:Serine carboxypeptidase S28